jgi:hypothetical protein
MIMRSLRSSAVAAAVFAIACTIVAESAQASFVYFVEQSGSSVIFTGSGSFNTSGTATGGIGAPVVTFANSNQIVTGSTSITTGTPVGTLSNWWFPLVVNPSPPALSTLVGSKTAASSTGPQMTFQSNNLLLLPASYVSNSVFITTAVFENSTLADFGWTAGTYASPFVNRTYTLTNGETVQFVGVPEPSNLVLAAFGGMVLGAWRLRRPAGPPISRKFGRKSESKRVI